MSTEYKLDDTVRVISGGYILKIGDSGIITEIDRDAADDTCFYRVTVLGRDNTGNWTTSNSIELISHSQPKDEVKEELNEIDYFEYDIKEYHQDKTKQILIQEVTKALKEEDFLFLLELQNIFNKINKGN